MFKFISDKKSRADIFRLIIFGLAAGAVNGLLGAGGGILIVFGLSPLLSRDPEGQRDVFANALAVMFPVSIVSVINYAAAGRFSIDGFAHYLIPCVFGGAIGALLLGKLKITFLQKLFALIVVWSGLYMVVR